jgi:hypothetical protein
MPCVKPIGFLRIGFGLPFQGGFDTYLSAIVNLHPSIHHKLSPISSRRFCRCLGSGSYCLYFNILPKYMLSMFVLFYNLISLFLAQSCQFSAGCTLHRLCMLAVAHSLIAPPNGFSCNDSKAFQLRLFSQAFSVRF